MDVAKDHDSFKCFKNQAMAYFSKAIIEWSQFLKRHFVSEVIHSYAYKKTN